MPKTVRKITCCYCDAATLVDLTKLGHGILTCDACGARLASARMEALVNKPVPVKRPAPARGPASSTATLDPRWQAKSPVPQKKKAKKSKPKKRKSFLDRLEDIWDEIEDIID